MNENYIKEGPNYDSKKIVDEHEILSKEIQMEDKEGF